MAKFPLLAASMFFGSLTTHYGNAVGLIIFGLGYVDQFPWWKIGHIMAFVGLATYLLVVCPCGK